jgi:hypothetical protein
MTMIKVRAKTKRKARVRAKGKEGSFHDIAHDGCLEALPS